MEVCRVLADAAGHVKGMLGENLEAQNGVYRRSLDNGLRLRFSLFPCLFPRSET